MKIKKFIKDKFTFVLGIAIGGILFYGGAYAVSIASKDVSYSNSTSGLTSTNVQGAVDELYTKADIRKRPNIVAAYTYNESTCVTGEESTCQRTECYKNKTAGSCPSGTIIDYKVNESTIVRFHVMFDEGNTITMQSQKATINRAYRGTYDGCTGGGCVVTGGPTAPLRELEYVTNNWSNVNDQTYALGTTVFKTNEYTGCNSTSCTENRYILPERTGKARMIVLQEVFALGCTSASICPLWLSPQMTASITEGSGDGQVWHIADSGATYVAPKGTLLSVDGRGGNQIRAVVIINK